jgi:hypothetical protein
MRRCPSQGLSNRPLPSGSRPRKLQTFNIFHGEFRKAYGATLAIAAQKLGPYFISASDEQSCIASVDTDRDSDASPNTPQRKRRHFREGVGQRGMRERVKELGGSFRVASGTLVGTSIIARIPLKQVLSA